MSAETAFRAAFVVAGAACAARAVQGPADLAMAVWLAAAFGFAYLGLRAVNDPA